MDNLTNLEKSIIVHVLFIYADYLRTFDYPFTTILKPEVIEQLALKINETYHDIINNG